MDQSLPDKRETDGAGRIKSIIILGAGVFGLSTLHALLSSHDTTDEEKWWDTVTLIDPHLPPLTTDDSNKSVEYLNPHGASFDSSRIIRGDYKNSAYTRLAQTAQDTYWRKQRREVYQQSGIVVTSNGVGDREYVSAAEENCRRAGMRVTSLPGAVDVRQAVLGTTSATMKDDTEGSALGDLGYENADSGWANAQLAMQDMMADVVRLAQRHNTRHARQVQFCRGKARRLLVSTSSTSKKVTGVEMDGGRCIHASTTVVATGAWTGSLVDLRGRAEARGQVLAYLPLMAGEASILKNMRVLLNCSSGMFAIPPVKKTTTTSGEWTYELKLARHGYGYRNLIPVKVCTSSKDTPNDEALIDITTSLPHTRFSTIPAEGERACRAFLRSLFPPSTRHLGQLADRPFSHTRLCWYSSTPTGDFIVDWHPECADKSLLLATGGSGHAFKFLPVIGGLVVNRLKGNAQGHDENEDEMMRLWRWREQECGDWGEEDGSRGGTKGAELEEEWKKT